MLHNMLPGSEEPQYSWASLAWGSPICPSSLSSGHWRAIPSFTVHSGFTGVGVMCVTVEEEAQQDERLEHRETFWWPTSLGHSPPQTRSATLKYIKHWHFLAPSASCVAAGFKIIPSECCGNVSCDVLVADQQPTGAKTRHRGANDMSQRDLPPPY